MVVVVVVVVVVAVVVVVVVVVLLVVVAAEVVAVVLCVLTGIAYISHHGQESGFSGNVRGTSISIRWIHS